MTAKATTMAEDRGRGERGVRLEGAGTRAAEIGSADGDGTFLSFTQGREWKRRMAWERGESMNHRTDDITAYVLVVEIKSYA